MQSRYAALIVVFSLAGCFEDPAPGGDETADATGATGPGTTAGSTSSADTGSPQTGSDPSSTGADPTGNPPADSTGGPPVVSVSGQMVTFFTDPGDDMVGGVQVSLLGGPDVMTVTDPQGFFTLDGVPAGQIAFLESSPSGSHHGSIVGVDVGFADVQGVELARFSKLGSQTIEEQLVEMDGSVAFNPMLGTITAHGSNAGLSVFLSPMPPSNQYYSVDLVGQPQLGDNTATNVMAPMVVFFNLMPTEPGAVELSATHPVQTCLPDFPQPPVMPDHITYIPVDCS